MSGISSYSKLLAGSLALGLALSFSVPVFALGRHKVTEPAPVITMPTLHKTIYKNEIIVQQADAALKEIDAYQWKPLPADTEGLSLKTVLVNIEKNNPQMLLKGENATVRQSLMQQALLEGVSTYTTLIRQWMNQVVLYHQLRVKQKELLVDIAQFEQGQTTSISVLRDQAALIDVYRQLQGAKVQYSQTSQNLALLAGLDPKITYFPKAIRFENDRYQINLPDIDSTDLNDKDIAQLASFRQPDLRQLEVTRDEFRMKFLGLSTITPTGAVHIKDLEQLIRQSRKAAAGVAQNASKRIQDAQAESDRAYANLQLAEKAYYQIQVSFESGFSSEKDIQEVALFLAKAQADQVNALANLYLAQVALVKEIGLLNVKYALTPLDAKTVADAIKNQNSPRVLNERLTEKEIEALDMETQSSIDSSDEDENSASERNGETSPSKNDALNSTRENEKTAPETLPQSGQ